MLAAGVRNRWGIPYQPTCRRCDRLPCYLAASRCGGMPSYTQDVSIGSFCSLAMPRRSWGSSRYHRLRRRTWRGVLWFSIPTSNWKGSACVLRVTETWCCRRRQMWPSTPLLAMFLSDWKIPLNSGNGIRLPSMPGNVSFSTALLISALRRDRNYSHPQLWLVQKSLQYTVGFNEIKK